MATSSSSPEVCAHSQQLVGYSLLGGYDRTDTLIFLRSQMGQSDTEDTGLTFKVSDVAEAVGHYVKHDNIYSIAKTEMINVDQESEKVITISPTASPLWKIGTALNLALGKPAAPTELEKDGILDERIARLVGKNIFGNQTRTFTGLWLVGHEQGIESLEEFNDDGKPLFRAITMTRALDYAISTTQLIQAAKSFMRLGMLGLDTKYKKETKDGYIMTDSPLWNIFRALAEIMPPDMPVGGYQPNSMI